MRAVWPAFTVTVAVLASLVSVSQCDGGASSSTPGLEEDVNEVVEEDQFCGDVVNTDRVHVPSAATVDQHHRLLQLHVRTNLPVSDNIQSACQYETVISQR